MNANQILEELKTKIQDGIDLESALRIFINYFQTTEVDSISVDEDSDMLLFQWGGPYSWDELFSVNLTRQIVYHDANGNCQKMQQLKMNCRYSADKVQIESGNFWLKNNNLKEFKKNIFDSEVFIKVQNLKMESIDLELSLV